MSLAGFDHVFANAVEMELPAGTRVRVAPPIVTTLLKIIAYVEHPHRRAKDLQDIRLVLGRYEAGSDRLFSDEVFDAGLPDFEMANAFLLGRDSRMLASATLRKNRLCRSVRQALSRRAIKSIAFGNLSTYSEVGKSRRGR